MENSMYAVLVDQAVESIKTIVDPIEKVKAITSLLPFVDKSIKVEDKSTEIQAVTADVDKQVENNIIEFEKEEKKQSVNEEKPTVVEAISTEDREAMIIKKFGKMTLREYISSEDTTLNKEFQVAAELKNSMTKFFSKYYPDNPNVVPATLKYYMALSDEDNIAVQEDGLNLSVQTYIEKFIPFAKALNTIYQYDADTIQKTVFTMSSGLKENGLRDVNIDNAGAVAAALQEVA